jgi:hypothetical protein
VDGDEREVRPPSHGQLERAHELAQQRLEVPDLLRIEPFQELAVARRQGGDGGVHHLEALVAAQQAAPLESIDPARDAADESNKPLSRAWLSNPNGDRYQQFDH